MVGDLCVECLVCDSVFYCCECFDFDEYFMVVCEVFVEFVEDCVSLCCVCFCLFVLCVFGFVCVFGLLVFVFVGEGD